MPSSVVGAGSRRTTVASSTKPATKAAAAASETSAKAPATAHEAATSTKTAASAESSTAKATTESTSEASSTTAGEAVLSHLKRTSLPVIAVELHDGVASVVRTFESYNSGTLRTAIGAHMNVGANDGTLLSFEVFNVRDCATQTLNTGDEHTSLTEQVFEILPADRVRKLAQKQSQYKDSTQSVIRVFQEGDKRWRRRFDLRRRRRDRQSRHRRRRSHHDHPFRRQSRHGLEPRR